MKIVVIACDRYADAAPTWLYLLPLPEQGEWEYSDQAYSVEHWNDKDG